MSVSEGLVITWAASISLAWCAAYVYAFRHALHIPLLCAFEPCHPDRWPRLSVIVAARDEASHLEQAVTTLLAQDYPDLEVVLVDDRSGDGTDRRVEALGRHDPRVRGVLVRELPRGWLGKTHALHNLV